MCYIGDLRFHLEDRICLPQKLKRLPAEVQAPASEIWQSSLEVRHCTREGSAFQFEGWLSALGGPTEKQ